MYQLPPSFPTRLKITRCSSTSCWPERKTLPASNSTAVNSLFLCHFFSQSEDSKKFQSLSHERRWPPHMRASEVYKNLPARFYRGLQTSGQSMCSNGRLAIETSIKNLISGCFFIISHRKDSPFKAKGEEFNVPVLIPVLSCTREWGLFIKSSRAKGGGHRKAHETLSA